MKARQLFGVVSLVVSLAVNLWFVSQRLETLFYARGLEEGRTGIAKQVVNQVETTGRLNITGTDGRNILMQVTVPTAPPLPPTLPGATAAPITPN